MNIQARTATLGAVLAATSLAFAQSNPAYIRFTPSATKGALYKPDSGPPPQAAILIIHRTANFMAHLRATDSMDGIDWCSSNNSPCALQKISAPILITAMGAHYFVRDNEIHFEMAASKDKEFICRRGSHPRHPTVQALRGDAGPVLEYRQELFRLPAEVDQCETVACSIPSRLRAVERCNW
jgi:hypothetical protein